MKYIVLLIALLWAFVGRSQGTIESCREMGLYFCTECSNTDLQCQTCSSGYILKSDRTGCLACPDNCTTCTTGDSTTTTKCITCNDGYYISNDACVAACPDNCAKCTTGDSTTTTKCTTCNDGYYVNNDACAACPANCLYCECVDGALICSNDRCATGYQRLASDKLCHACPNNCATCTESTTTPGQLVCETCQSQFALNKTACAACHANCAKCSVVGADTLCGTCEDGYYMDSYKVCQTCPNNCATCTESNTTPVQLVCETCQSQFALNKTACAACPANCAKCSVVSAKTVCDTCEDGYYMDSDKVCQNCATLTGITNCATCVAATSDTSAKCVSCTTDYTISDDAKQCFSTATIGTGCLTAAYKPPSCSVCQEGVGAELVFDKCYISCYTCGSLTNNVPTSTVAECNAQGNEYLNKTCGYGCSIAIKYDNNEMIFASRGCVVNATCLSDGVEQCTDTGPSQNCLKCCDSGELCNGDYWDPSSVPASHVIGIITMSVTILAAYVIN